MFGSSSWTVLIGELIHAKVTDIRDKLFIFDYIVLDGNYALGTFFKERQKTLNERFQPFLKAEGHSHWLASEDVWLAKTLRGNLLHTFRSMDKPEDEGLVLKNPDGFLRDCGKEGANDHWQVKVRHPKTNYAF
jgi:ATP-dependent DNA ligase